MSRDQTTKKLMEEMKAHQQKKDRVRSSVTTEEFRVEPLLLHNERSQLRRLRHPFRTPPLRELQFFRPGGGPEEAQDPLEKLYLPAGIGMPRSMYSELIHCKRMKLLLMTTPSQNLVKEARAKCTHQTVLKWLRDNSQSDYFSSLADVFHFFKEKINEEEKKDHSNTVDIIFVSHGAIRDGMIPACCMMPLPSVTDVVLYSPWNCATDAYVSYALATGKLRFSDRVFETETDSSDVVPAPAPDKLPNRWNSMKEAGEQMIPNIMVSPLISSDGVWSEYQSLEEKHGPPGRNRIVIPFLGSEVTVGSVPFFVVSLALSLALDSSRFTATVHLDCCLSDESEGTKFDPEYLKRQYAYTKDDITMTVPDDMFDESLPANIKRLFG